MNEKAKERKKNERTKTKSSKKNERKKYSNGFEVVIFSTKQSKKEL